jgi:hypothetical protein
MLKEGRKPSSDPAQEKLRQDKAAWNKDVSSFINDVIHLKKTMNGWPSKYFKERSKIVMPIPGDPGSILSNLSSKFQELSQRGEQIAQEQAQYSRSRKQKRTEQASQTLNKLDEKYGPTAEPTAAPLGGPAAPPNAADLTKQLATSLQEKYQLTAEGSNPFSRFLTRVTTPKIGFGDKAKIRRLRMSLLKSAVKAYKNLGRFQVHILKSSKQSLPDAHKLAHEAWLDWSTVSRAFNLYVNSLPAQTGKRPEEMQDEAVSPIEKAEKEEKELIQQNRSQNTNMDGAITDSNIIQDIALDVNNYAPIFTDKESLRLRRALSALKIRYMGGDQNINPLPVEAPAALGVLYQQLISHLNNLLKTNGTSLQQIYSQSNTKPEAPASPVPSEQLEPNSSKEEPVKAASSQLETVAQAFVKKWLGQTRHKLLPGDTSSTRLQLFDLSKQARQNINEIMNLLEKGLDIDSLDPKISEVVRQVTTIRSLTRSLFLTEKPSKVPTSPMEWLV